MRTAQKIKQTAIAIFITGVIATFIVESMLANPSGDFSFQFILTIFLLSIAGPINYPFLWNYNDASLIEIIAFLAFFVIPSGLYYYWFAKKHSPVILSLLSFMWVGFGGLSTLTGIAVRI